MAWAVAEASAQEIDQTDILQASLLAMTRAVKALLETQPDFVKVDGNRLPKLHYPSEAIVKGDTKVTPRRPAFLQHPSWRK